MGKDTGLLLFANNFYVCMMEQLVQLDYSLFEWIHHGWQTAWLDAIMPYWREKTTWIPLYLLLVAGLIYQYKLPGLYYLLALGLAVGIADFSSSQLIKKSVKRPRPCRETALSQPTRDVGVHCGGGYSFTSSHATNHFAVAIFLFLGWGRRWKKWRWLLLIWAATIAFGQVYVGVHYPLDVLCGSLLGSLIGWGVYKIYERRSWRIPDFCSLQPPQA